MWRTLQRSPAYIRTLHQLHAVPRDGFLAKLRFRKDGNPRSKLIGVANVFLSLTTLCYVQLSYEQRKFRLHRAATQRMLLAGIKLQDLDSQYYDQVDLNDPKQCFDYFFQLADCLGLAYDPPISYEKMAMLLRPVIETVHAPMREAVEDIHCEIQRFTREPLCERALQTMPAIYNTMTRAYQAIPLFVEDAKARTNVPHLSSAVDLSGSESDHSILG